MELGLAKLVGTDEELLFSEMTALLEGTDAYSRMSRVANPYGDGHASRRIALQLMAEAGMPQSEAAC
jgi:UDP-N-acetylglucosamine 2-epimerase (non-hydrolysing)